MGKVGCDIWEKWVGGEIKYLLVPLEDAEELEEGGVAKEDPVADLHRRRVERLHRLDGEIVDARAELLLRIHSARGEDELPSAVEGVACLGGT